MTGKQTPHPVSDTAALVMLWACGYYAADPLTGRYLEKLDLSAGKPLLDCYNAICPWYAEVIVNRKHFIRNTVVDLIGTGGRQTVILNLGAGFSPLALEISPVLGRSTRFIEIDMKNMDLKRRLYSELVPDRCGFITCIEGDITDPTTLKGDLATLIGDPENTRIITVMEGLSYYIGRPAMERAVDFLSGFAPDLGIVFEHLKPCRLIGEERRFIPYRIFSHVRNYTGLERMTTYAGDEIRAMLPSDFSFRYFDMDEMEQRRTGSRRYFPTPESGWLSCAVAVRRPGRDCPK